MEWIAVLQWPLRKKSQWMAELKIRYNFQFRHEYETLKRVFLWINVWMAKPECVVCIQISFYEPYDCRWG